MDKDFVPYLCGGIFFSFLTEFHKDTTQELYSAFGQQKIINHPQIMEKLIYVINPDYVKKKASSFQKTVSQYQSCKTNGGNIIPFECDLIRTEFDKSVKNQYREVLKRMTNFTINCFPKCNNTAMRVLVKRTLMIIRDDSSITNDISFFVNENGFSISKEDLLKKEDFNFQSFLVGIWHYIITSPTQNIDGEKTFEKLFPRYSGKKRKINTNCLEPFDHEINITQIEASTKSLPKGNNEFKNITEPANTGQKGKKVVDIFYKGSLLNDEDEKIILSNSPAIIDLNEIPDISIINNPISTIYKITAEFQFKTHFLPSRERIVRLYCSIGSSNISGTTSAEKWLSKSKFNEMCFYQKYSCTAWFRLNYIEENEYSAEFLIIGRLTQ